MDISSTSSATVASAEVSTSSRSEKTSKSNSSFKDEMQKVSEAENKEAEQTEQDSEQKTDAADTKNEENTDNDQNLTLKGEATVTADQNQQITGLNGQNPQNSNIQALLDANMQLTNLTRMNNTFAQVKVDYSTVEMGADDAKFFSDLVQNTDKTLQNVADTLSGGIEQNVQKTTQHVKVSATLMNALNEAVKTNQPFRINLDKDVSIIIKVDKDGALSATFIPGDKAVEEYLRQNISVLRQRFDEQELSYRDLSYSRQKQNQEQNRRNNNKENDHE